MFVELKWSACVEAEDYGCLIDSVDVKCGIGCALGVGCSSCPDP